MKNKILLFAIVLMCTSISVNVNATVNKKTLKEKVAAMTEEQKEARIIDMKQRVEEIKKMDKSQLTALERKELRDELRNMNKEAKAIRGSGIYISIGALLVVILLLILLL